MKRKTIRLCTIGNGKRLHEVPTKGSHRSYYWTACALSVSSMDYRRSKLYGSGKNGAMTNVVLRRLCKTCMARRLAENVRTIDKRLRSK
jgi:hypothetical protein